MSNKECRRCKGAFILTDEDRAFYQKFEVPDPTLCPRCREWRRMVQVNQLHLFRRVCDATSKPIITHYPPECRIPVFSQAHWYSDAVDNTKFGRPFDFSRPFFEQFSALSQVVPRPALFTDYLRDENSAYTNYAGRNKNCYLIFDSDENRDCYYGYSLNSCTDVHDSYRNGSGQLCYEAVDANKCYNCAYVWNCESCIDSAFLLSCVGCRNCFMCCNLRQKEYYAFNKPVSKETFEALRAQLASHSSRQSLVKQFAEYQKSFPQKCVRGMHNENVIGNNLVHSKNAYWCFDCRDLWDGRYCYQAFMSMKDSMDCHETGEGELLYECSNIGYNAYRCRFTMMSLDQITDLTYCDSCFMGCSNLFGCIGLRRKQFCVLNQEYSESEYRMLVGKIIQHMQSTGEWGEFFPPKISAYPYNVSIASQLFPMSREEALREGLTWHDEKEVEAKEDPKSMPDSIVDCPLSVTERVFSCESCGKAYKIIAQELSFLKTATLPLPRRCFLCRHNDRVAGRLPRDLWLRECSKCHQQVHAAFPPQSDAVIYCDPCFQESVE